MSHSRTQGFSMIEVILVLALIGVIALFSIGLTFNSLGRSAVAQERDLFVSLLLRGARAAAIANINESSHGIHIDNDLNEYVLFQGTTYNASASTNRTISFTSDNIDVTGATDIVFEQLSGDVANEVTLALASGEQTSSIIIRETGQIDW